MGRLEPGAKYIYEHYDGITYARKFGAPHSERFEIGRTYERETKDQQLFEDKLWHDIRRAALDNTELQEAIDRVKIIYYLSRKNGQE